MNPFPTPWHARRYLDLQRINRNCGWICRIVGGRLVRVALVQTLRPPRYIK